MKQNCDNCAWKNAPCQESKCVTYRKNNYAREYVADIEARDHWTPARPWEEKWIVPEGCYIIGVDKSGLMYIGMLSYNPVKWNVSDGKCFKAGERSRKRDLIPKTPSIEETPEFKEYSLWFDGESWVDHCNQKLSTFKELQKIFKMELKQAD